MLSRFKAYLVTHFSQHITLYFVVILCFAVGVMTGVFSVKLLSESQKNELIDYLVVSFKSLLIDNQVNNTQIFLQSIYYNVRTILLFWVTAVVVIGFPLIFLIIIIRGFTIGFTVGFIIEYLGYKGILFSIVSILPQNIFNIPILVVFGVISVNYSISIIKIRKLKPQYKREKSKMFMAYSLVALFMCMLLVVGSFIEGYISPVLLNGITNYLLS